MTSADCQCSMRFGACREQIVVNQTLEQRLNLIAELWGIQLLLLEKEKNLTTDCFTWPVLSCTTNERIYFNFGVQFALILSNFQLYGFVQLKSRAWGKAFGYHGRKIFVPCDPRQQWWGRIRRHSIQSERRLWYDLLSSLRQSGNLSGMQLGSRCFSMKMPLQCERMVTIESF